MTQTILERFSIPVGSVFAGLSTVAGIVIATGGTIAPALAQYPTCQPPRQGEYLLLVVSRTPETQARVRNLVSRDATITVCNYVQETVTRVGGFRDAESASSWASYLNDTVGLQAFVARPSSRQTAASQNRDPFPTNDTPPPSRSTNEGFNPQRLGAGYAVIVNYRNRPEVASQVQQALNRPIGLASYGQRPFLLAVHTSDRAIADSILQTLNDRGFAAAIVDSRRVTLLTPQVSIGSN